jgi:hypothetical protein
MFERVSGAPRRLRKQLVQNGFGHSPRADWNTGPHSSPSTPRINLRPPARVARPQHRPPIRRETWDVRNLIVADGSCFPTPTVTGVTPSISTEAVAYMNSKRLAAALA